MINDVSRPIKICEAKEIQCSACCIVNPEGDGALHILKDALGSILV